MPPAACRPLDRRVGGRFWALADEGDEGEGSEEEDASPSTPSAAVPPSSLELDGTPSSLICDLLNQGYDEDDLQQVVESLVPASDPARDGLAAADHKEVIRRIVLRRLSSRPWKGPMPKVIFRASTWIRTWSLLSRADLMEHMDIGCSRREMVARDTYIRFGWRSTNRIGV
ncbi:uncharacterized protein [Triticum aestivum]|uniref:uncharacterized protein n=1 Tax=Triticum aestivum TaxID=4565 RepID=UPI001D00C13F|nr:uncharacterized protein LOC123082996 [Triticum aestivum]